MIKWYVIVYLSLVMLVTGCAAHSTQGFRSGISLSDVWRLKTGDDVERYQTLIELLNQEKHLPLNLLTETLSDADPNVRYLAAWLINNQGWSANVYPGNAGIFIPEAINILQIRLSDPDPWVRMEIFRALSQLERTRGMQVDKNVIDNLLVQTKDANPLIRAEAIKALYSWSIDENIQKARRDAFHDQTWLVREGSFFGGYGNGLNNLMIIMGNNLIQPNSQSRDELHNFLQQNKDLWQTAIRDEDQRIRRATATQMRGFEEDQNAHDLLIERLGDPDGQIVFEVLSWVTQLKETRALDSLLDLQMSAWKDHPFLRSAIETISGLPIEKAMTKQEGKPRRNVQGSAPINYPNPNELERHFQALKSPDQNERVTLALLLTWVKNEKSENALLELMSDQDPLVRWASLLSLSSNPSQMSGNLARFLDKLKLMTNDPNPHVRQSAVSVINKMRGKYYKERLNLYESVLKNEKDPFVKWSAIQGISEFSALWNVNLALVDALKDPFIKIRETAAETIDIICWPQETDLMIQALNDPSSTVRWAVAHRLRLGSSAQVIAALRQIRMTDTDESVRRTASGSMNMITTVKKSGYEPLAEHRKHCDNDKLSPDPLY